MAYLVNAKEDTSVSAPTRGSSDFHMDSKVLLYDYYYFGPCNLTLFELHGISE